MVIVRTQNGKPIFSTYGKFLLEFVIGRLPTANRNSEEEEDVDCLLLTKKEGTNQKDAENPF
jgi:hypothetical protein